MFYCRLFLNGCGFAPLFDYLFIFLFWNLTNAIHAFDYFCLQVVVMFDQFFCFVCLLWSIVIWCLGDPVLALCLQSICFREVFSRRCDTPFFPPCGQFYLLETALFAEFFAASSFYSIRTSTPRYFTATNKLFTILQS